MKDNRKRLAALVLALSMVFSLLGTSVRATELPGGSGALSGQSVEEQTVKVGNAYYATLKEAIGAANAGETVTLLRNAETRETLTVAGTLTLDLNGNGIRYAGTSPASVITVSEQGKLTLTDSDSTAVHYLSLTDGRGTSVSESASAGAVKVTGGYVTGGFGADYGGGVLNQGSFTMSGGTIVGNTALKKGGGVCNGRAGTFVMNGGSICRNAAPLGGGVLNRNVFQLSGSPVITGNHVSAGENAAESNVYLEKKETESTIIAVSGPLSCPIPIGVAMQKRGVFTSGLLGKGGVECFSSDEGSFEVAMIVDGASAGEAKLIQASATAPVINSESGVTLNYGYTTGKISVGVTAPKGHSLSYQWYLCENLNRKNPTPVNGNGESYTIPVGKNAMTTEYYYCVVTATRDDNGETKSLASGVMTVTVRKAGISPSLTMDGWVYGAEPNSPKLKGNPGNGEVRYTYHRQTKPAQGNAPAEYDEGTERQPTEAGVYKVVAHVAETGNYKGETAEAVFTIAKAAQQTPAAPEDPTKTVGAVSSASLTIAARPGEEYSIDGGITWVSDDDHDGLITFDNLEPGTTYTFLGRAAGDENHEPSEPYGAGQGTTERGTQSPPDVPMGKEVTDTSITIAARPGEEYSIDNGETWKRPEDGKDTVTFTGLSPGTEYHLLARKYETDTLNASEPSEDRKLTTANPGESKVYTPADNATYQGLTDTEKKQADELAEAFGNLKLDLDTLAQMLKTAQSLGVSQDTAKLSAETLSKLPDDSDPKGSSFSKLLARATKRSKNAMVLQWKRIKQADGYLIYGNRCGKKYKLEPIRTIKSNKTVKLRLKKLKKGTYYKYMVIAYKDVNGLRMPIAASVTVHAATRGTKYTIAKEVRVNTKKVSLSVGESFQLKASEVKDEARKTISAHRPIKYESIHPKVAKVNKNGGITGKKAGTTTIYVYAQNGLYKKVKVTVK